MEELLNDTNNFVPTKFSNRTNKELKHILNMEETINITLKKLHKDKLLSNQDFYKLSPKGSQPGILYGSAKIHKALINNIPKFRPILSAINTPSYNIAKFLVPILSTLTMNEYTVKDSFGFAKDIVQQNNELIMASFDVDALFSNIPLDETINICIDELFKNNSIVKNLNRNQVKELLELATKQSFFIFNDKFYTQVDGVAMGSPLGPTLANSFLCYHEKKWLEQCPNEFRPVFYQRYVDDIFVLFKSRDHIDKFHSYLNSRHEKMKFSVEVEKENKLSFLDISITRDIGANSFKTSLYRKPTFSGVYTNFKSFIDYKYKLSLLHSLLFRIFNICSDYNAISLEIDKLKVICQKNKYPIRVIEKCIFHFFNKIFVKKSLVYTVPKKKLIISLEYLGKQSSVVKKRLQHIIKESIPFCNVLVVFTSNNRLRNGFSFKDRIPKCLKSHLIYNFKCGSCEASYVGKTFRHYQIRTSEHLGISKLTNKPLSYSENTATAIRKHQHYENHNNTAESFKIIGYAKNESHLLIKESLSIQQLNPVLNKTVKSAPLYLFN